MTHTAISHREQNQLLAAMPFDDWRYIESHLEWVEMPNTRGMALCADGGFVASKPYAASGAYIKRMSDYCHGCRYDPGAKTGEQRCPVTIAYWNFLRAHPEKLKRFPRLWPLLKQASTAP